jgi:hypothetical protein
MGTSTPWGISDYKKTYARGINFYGTPSHGGFKLSATLNAKVDPRLRIESGFYEEDEEWCIVAFTFPDIFPDMQESALKTLRSGYPDQYEAITGQAIQPGQSWKRDQKIFEQANQDKLVVVSAVMSNQRPGMVECHATKGGRRGDGVEYYQFFVPKGEYDTRSPFGFVIDPARHQEMPSDQLDQPEISL